MRVELFREFILVMPEHPGGSCCLKPHAKETKKSQTLGRHLGRLGRRHDISWREGNCLKSRGHPLWKLKIYTRFLPALKEFLYGVREKPCIVVREADSFLEFVFRRLIGRARWNIIYYSEDLEDFDVFEERLLNITLHALSSPRVKGLSSRT